MGGLRGPPLGARERAHRRPPSVVEEDAPPAWAAWPSGATTRCSTPARDRALPGSGGAVPASHPEEPASLFEREPGPYCPSCRWSEACGAARTPLACRSNWGRPEAGGTNVLHPRLSETAEWFERLRGPDFDDIEAEPLLCSCAARLPGPGSPSHWTRRPCTRSHWPETKSSYDAGAETRAQPARLPGARSAPF
jgi:hypothetical protein